MILTIKITDDEQHFEHITVFCIINMKMRLHWKIKTGAVYEELSVTNLKYHKLLGMILLGGFCMTVLDMRMNFIKER